MNAFELFTYHFAAGAGQAKVRYVSTGRTAAEISAGIDRVGGDGNKAEVVPLPTKGKYTVPDIPGGTRVVVDDFATIALEDGFEESLDRLATIREQARKHKVEVLISMTTGILDKASEVRMRMWADGVMELGFDRQGFGLYPYLKVTKMRGVPESSRFILFKETDAGLFMESTRRVF